MTSEAMTHLADGIRLTAIIKLKENFLICLVATRIATASINKWKLILPLKILIRNKAPRCHSPE